MDWSRLQSFLEVAETGSVSAAAKRLKVSQPTLSRHIRALEQALGLVLFSRSVSGAELTPDGLRLIDQARAMKVAAQTITLKANGSTESLKGTVRLTASCVMATYILPPILTAIRRAEPQIELEVVASDAAQNLLQRDADIAVRMFRPTQPSLMAHHVGDSPMAFYAHHAYLDLYGTPHRMEEILDHAVIGFDRHDDIVRGFEAMKYPVDRHFFPVRSDDQVVYFEMLRAGAGIGFAQTALGDVTEGLVRLDLNINLPTLPIWVVMHEEVKTNARIRRVADLLYVKLKAWLTASKKQP